MRPSLLVASMLPSLGFATSFWNTGNFDIWVQDRNGNNNPVSAHRSVDIEGGWAFVWADSKSGGSSLNCPGFAFKWPSNYGAVYWTYATFGKPSVFHDAKGNNITPQDGNQICSVH
ncbi:hypothetical protein NQ176_g1539 [Zarea fungicola]|uniref:Uncharacterized protein n=1 Tax=Zarea fungicola TaxID=93591 RepID=A0ACC1NTF2_9HYPO|nr:hypothetical protein NQ176_g1539 [Lecanicillium fungicola]